MPFTVDIDETFSITVAPASKVASRQFSADATIYNRHTNKPVGEASGMGGTASRAEETACANAKDRVLQMKRRVR